MKKLEPAPKMKSNLSPEYSEHLLNLVINEEFNQLINDVNEKYEYWDKVKYLKTPGTIKPEDVWMVAKIRRMNSPFKIQFGNHKFSWFLTSDIQALLHLFDLNIGGSLESRSLIPKDEKDRYLLSSIMEEAIASSQIEGAVTTRKQAKEMLRKNRQPKTHDERMIYNNYLTIQRILQLKDLDLTTERILEIHKLISAGTLADRDDEGMFRHSNDVNVVDVIDGDIVYSPPPYSEIEKLVTDLCDFFNDDNEPRFIHPIIKGCIIHFMIGYIHPFVDGNGRAARALFYWYMLRKGYWLTEYLSISKLILRSKGQYARAFQYTEIDDNDLTYFIKYKLKTMQLAFQSLREYIQRKIDEKRQVTEFMKFDGVNDRQAMIIKWFYEEPSLLLSVKEVETRLAVSNQTARTDLQHLSSIGILNTLALNKKQKAFTRGDGFGKLFPA